jgi:isoaspartyl peptidase/L-asparaginase-like protein (Ntn-hydrolase superfamily)
MPQPVVIATWPFGRQAVEKALPLLTKGEPALDAALAGAQAVEDDVTIRNSVGFGSLPDRLGRLTLDASVMDGRTLACGAVAAVEHIRHPAALARRVMEKTPHVLLVGEGAKWFALQEGFPLEQPYTLAAIREWLERHPALRPDKPKPEKKSPQDERGVLSLDSPDPETCRDGASAITVGEWNHDTVTVLALDTKGHLGGVCTTSGLAYKLPGRVGDSPIIGAGLYVDDTAGAAGATGVGEEIIRIGGSLLIVEWMRAGKSPQEACEMACQRVNAAAARRGVHPARVAFLALDPKGNVGAACTAKTNFRYALGREGKIELLQAKEVPPQA